MRTVLAWAPCAVLLPRPLRSLTLIRCARPSSHSLPLLGLGGRVCAPLMSVMLCGPLPRTCSCGFFRRWSASCSQGEVPEAVRPHVRGASIMALRKPNGSLRPIAVGETIRRLTSKIAEDFISERARVVLEPLQLGVKTPNGCEAIIHTAGNGSTATVLMRVRLHSLLTFPTRSTRSTGRQCCSLSAFISLRLLRGLTAVIVMIVSSSLAPQVISSARGVQQGILLAPFSSHLPSTLSFWIA